MFTAIPKALIPKEPYASFLVADKDVAGKPLKGMRIGIVREYYSTSPNAIMSSPAAIAMYS